MNSSSPSSSYRQVPQSSPAPALGVVNSGHLASAYTVQGRRLLVLAGSLLYIGALLIAYWYNISVRFAHSGYAASTPSPTYLVIAIPTALLPALWLSISIERPSTLILWCLYGIVYIPSCIIPPFVSGLTTLQATALPVMLALAMLLLSSVSWLPRLRLTLPGLSVRWFMAGLFTVSLLSILAIISVFGIDLRLPTLDEVYGVRAEYKTSLIGENSRVSYLLRWSQYLFGPLWIVYGLTHKRLLWIVGGVFFHLLVYSITASKTAVALIFVVVGLWLIARYQKRFFGVWVIYGLLATVIGAYGVDLLLSSDIGSSLLIRRTLITPGLLTSHYFEFFSNNPLGYLANNRVFGWLFRLFGFEYVYPITIPYQVGWIFFGYADRSANANFWADAFANFGFIGVYGYTLILASILYVYDSLAIRKNFLMSRLLLVGPAIGLLNSGLLVVLIGSGLLLSLLLLTLSPNAGTSQKSKEKRQQLPLLLNSPESPARVS